MLSNARDRTTVLPQVLADGECDVDATDAHDAGLCPWHEVAEFVEHTVVRQVMFVVRRFDLALEHHA